MNGEKKKEELESHLEDVRSWMEGRLDSQRSIDNYMSSIKRFYQETGIEPINPEELGEEDTARLNELLITSTTSRSMKFGLQKYFSYLSHVAPDMESESRIGFLRRKLEDMSFNVEERDIESKVISTDKVGKIVDKASSKEWELGVLYRMMYETATRASGMYLLEWRDVLREEYSGESLEPNELFISKDRSKGKENGVVQVTDTTYNQLMKLRNDRDQDLLGTTEKVFYPEMTRESVYKKMYRHTKDIEPSTHWFRHSRLTHLGMKMYEKENLGYDTILGKLQRYARHKDSKTTEIYIDIVKKKVARKDEKMDKYLQESWS